MSNGFFSNAEKNEYIKKSLEKRLSKYGNIDYAFIVMAKRKIDDIVVISSLADYFSEVYVKNQYQSIDPVMINALNRVSPLVWDENLMINSQWTIKKIFQSVKSYNIVSGQTFILHDPHNNLSLLSLYIDKFIMSEVDENVKKNKNDIQGLLIDMHELLFHLYREENVTNENTGNTLSARENEILYWSSTGKTYPEIARMLNITVSTVKFHMGKIVKKLGVNNAKHAISLAIELNIISHPSGR